MSQSTADVLAEFAAALAELGWVTALQVTGSLATGDHREGASDLDLVALVNGQVETGRRAQLIQIHQRIPRRWRLGCVYVPANSVTLTLEPHVTWTHGQMIERPLSPIARAELTRQGYALFGPDPDEVFHPVADEYVRRAAAQELTGYWSWALPRLWLWFVPDHVDLAATSVLRARHSMRTGELVTKGAVLEGAAHDGKPPSCVNAARRRRAGEARAVDRLLLPLHGLAAWQLTRSAISEAQCLLEQDP